MLRNHIARFLFILILGTPWLSSLAQEQETVQVRFVSFPISADNSPVELLCGDGSTIRVQLPTNSLSDSYTVVRPKQWVLGKTIPDADNKPSFAVYGKAAAPAAKEQIVLVTRKGPNHADGFVMTPFAADDKGFGGGKYIFFNAAKVEIGCELGNLRFKLVSNQHRLLAPKASAVKNGRKYLYTRLHYRLGDKTKPFYESTWRFNDKARSMVFIYHDTHTRQLRTHSIRSFLR